MLARLWRSLCNRWARMASSPGEDAPSANKEPALTRAIHIPFLVPYVSAADMLRRIRIADILDTENTNKVTFEASSVFQLPAPLTSLDDPRIRQQSYSTYFAPAFVTWTEQILAIIEAQQDKNSYALKEKLGKYFALPSDAQRVLLSNIIALLDCRDKAVGTALVAHACELFDPITLQPLAMMCMPDLDAIHVDLVDDPSKATADCELVYDYQDSDDPTTPMMIYLLIYNNGKKKANPCIFLPLIHAPKFPSHYRLINDQFYAPFTGDMMEKMSTLFDIFTEYARKGLLVAGSHDLIINIHHFIDVAIYVCLQYSIVARRRLAGDGQLLQSHLTTFTLQRHYEAWKKTALERLASDPSSFCYDPLSVEECRKYNEFMIKFYRLLKTVPHDGIMDFITSRIGLLYRDYCL